MRTRGKREEDGKGEAICRDERKKTLQQSRKGETVTSGRGPPRRKRNKGSGRART